MLSVCLLLPLLRDFILLLILQVLCLAMCRSIVRRSGVQVNVIIAENTPLDNKREVQRMQTRKGC